MWERIATYTKVICQAIFKGKGVRLCKKFMQFKLLQKIEGWMTQVVKVWKQRCRQVVSVITKAIGWVGNLVKQYNFEKIEGAYGLGAKQRN